MAYLPTSTINTYQNDIPYMDPQGLIWSLLAHRFTASQNLGKTRWFNRQGCNSQNGPCRITLWKLNIDTKNGHVWKESPFRNHHFGYPAVSFQRCIRKTAKPKTPCSSNPLWEQSEPNQLEGIIALKESSNFRLKESGWWFSKILVHPYLGRWFNLILYFFKWVETTN